MNDANFLLDEALSVIWRSATNVIAVFLIVVHGSFTWQSRSHGSRWMEWTCSSTTARNGEYFSTYGSNRSIYEYNGSENREQLNVFVFLGRNFSAILVDYFGYDYSWNSIDILQSSHLWTTCFHAQLFSSTFSSLTFFRGKNLHCLIFIF